MEEQEKYLTTFLIPYLDNFNDCKYSRAPGRPLRSYLTVWLPFASWQNPAVGILLEAGFEVIWNNKSDIPDDYDYLKYEPERSYDIIVAVTDEKYRNSDTIKRLLELKKPFVMAFYLSEIQSSLPKMLEYEGYQALLFTERGSEKDFDLLLCRDFLPRDLMIKDLSE